MADSTNHFGGPRHAPQANIADPDLFGRNAVGTISRPALDSDVAGTGALLSGPKRNRPKGSRSMGSPNAAESPLDTSAHDEIIRASGLGRQAPRSWGEDASDATEPTQAVRSVPGGFVHYRRNPATGNVSGTPIGSPTLDDYPGLNYRSMPRNLGELQANLGTENYSPGD